MAEIQLQIRRDTAANWSTNNPTPAAGEWTYETDTGVVKIGDGTTTYNLLAEFGGGGLPAGTVTNSALRWSGTAWVEEVDFQINTNGNIASFGVQNDISIQNNIANTVLFQGSATTISQRFATSGVNGYTWQYGSGITLTDAQNGDTVLTYTKNADLALFNNDVETARTATLLSGGFEVNNTVTGGGFERALTTSDLGTSIPGRWQYDNTTTAADPGSGNFRLNNTTIASATALYIGDESKGGTDFSNVLNGLGAGDRIYLQNGEDATESLLLTVATVADNTGWFTITFTVDDTGTATTWTDGKEFAFILGIGASGGGGIASVLEDTSPQLGGNLDANGFDIALDSTDRLYFNGQGGGTYIHEVSANNLSFVSNSIERARIAPNLVSFYDDNVEIGGGSGSQVSLFLDAQTSTGDTAIYFRSGGVTGGLIFYDRSVNSLDLYANGTISQRVRSTNILLGSNDTTQYTLLRGQTNALLGLSGGSGTASGFNMLLYGQATTSFANDFVMRANTTELLRYDHSLESFQFNRPAYFAEQTLTDAANIAWDLNTNQAATVTLGGNRTLSNPTNQRAGASYTLRIVQDATGSRTLAYGTAYKFPGGTAPTLSTGANDVDLLCCVSDGTNMLCVLNNDFS